MKIQIDIRPCIQKAGPQTFSKQINKEVKQYKSDISPAGNMLESPVQWKAPKMLCTGGGRKRHPVWGLSELSVSVSSLALAAPWPSSRPPGPPLLPAPAHKLQSRPGRSPPAAPVPPSTHPPTRPARLCTELIQTLSYGGAAAAPR